ncbi:MAG: helix-turn-helix domain-containing protein [Clostridia bacterium]|jgi:transcriptional regulator with XRE-family HTH domain|nr:helix-turn-helix domain-containing protein [Clostridia bacterium]
MSTLRELREENGKSRAEVAAALGVTVQAMANYEKGRRRISLEQVLILSKEYCMTSEEIINVELITIGSSNKVIG